MSQTSRRTPNVAGDHGTPGEIGTLLRGARLARGEDLAWAAQLLCVPAAFLDALEEGAPDLVPDPPGADAILRVYARHLGLAEDRPSEAPTAELRPVAPPDARRRSGGWPRRGLAVAGLASLLLLAGAYAAWRSDLWPPRHGEGPTHEGDRPASSAEPAPHPTADRAEGEAPAAGPAVDANAGGATPTDGPAAATADTPPVQAPAPVAGAGAREPGPEGGGAASAPAGGTVADDAPGRPPPTQAGPSPTGDAAGAAVPPGPDRPP